MTGAGELNQRVAFDKRDLASDGAGGTITEYAQQFIVSAKYSHLRGGETILAARLAGQHTQVIRVRASTQTRQADQTWRLRDKRTGQTFNIRDVTPSDDRVFLDFLCESGGAT